MPDFSWSYSRFSLWAKCPAAHRYKNIEKIPEPSSPALEKGRRVHDEIAKWLAGAEDTRPDSFGKFTALGDQLRALPRDRLLIEHQVALDRDMRPVSWFGKNAWFRAAFDVLIMPGPHYTAADHKTGKRYASYGDQQEIFALPMFWLDPKAESFTGHWLYLETGEVDTVTFDRAKIFGPSCDPAKKDGLHGLWLARAGAMESDKAFAPTPSQDACRFCTYSWRKNGPCKAGV